MLPYPPASRSAVRRLARRASGALLAVAVLVGGAPVAAQAVEPPRPQTDAHIQEQDIVDAETPFGYLMVHFIEDSDGYAEKIYLDVSRGDDPEQWDPLNGGEPILASDLGTTGVRDPYLTYSPESDTYYIIATDLRVFGGDGRDGGACTEWCHWASQGSTKLNVWESKDLVTWSDLRQIDVATTADNATHAELGMAWAPEATWVDDYDGEGEGAFVVYWSSNVYDDPEHTGDTYSRVLWGATTDFTQETYEYGGTLVDQGANAIDTTIIQDEGTTYRITKDNGLGKGIYMEATDAGDWWADETSWSMIQTEIGASWAGGNAGGVEGPAIFKRHDDDHWYLYVDVIPSIGYRPMETSDLDAGWTELHSDDFFMTPSTKHGGVISLTKGQYDRIRGADAVAVPDAELGSFEVASGADGETVRGALPATADVTLAYSFRDGELPVDWDVSTVNTATSGTYDVTGTVRSIGANLNDWVGDGGSTEWDAEGKELFSSTALTVTAEVVVGDAASLTATAATRCAAGKAVLAVSVTGGTDAEAVVTTPFGERTLEVDAGRTTSVSFSTREQSIPAGEVEAAAGAATTTATYPAKDCG
ncbi:family 43 glycosylhydrolase [Microbacterium halophytorum]|uniref:family 43 glycosylhydrolase n=1 Tax=Microbacterium halophytorum TaxID=2067568 RepID=UPI001319D239|nr:family 43 glycosylhydrolase [Microbacterium halophytorum]